MIKIAVVYYTKTDITGKLARAIITAARTLKDVELVEHRIEGREIVEGRFVNGAIFEELENCDAIVFASPTYMGGVAAQFKAFADATSDLWCEQIWAGKIAAGMTSGCSPNGDQSSTLQYMVTLAAQHGMIWVGLDSANGYDTKGINRLGCQLGVVSLDSGGVLDESDIETARYLGQRVIDLARLLKSGN